jgi:hypothetical protein
MPVVFSLYESYGGTGDSPIYTFPVVFYANYPHSGKKIIAHGSVRAKGEIIKDAGEESWDLTIKGVLGSGNDDYDTIMGLIDTMESTIALNTPYILEITSGATTHTYNVKRLVAIEYPPDDLRVDSIEYTCILRVSCW